MPGCWEEAGEPEGPWPVPLASRLSPGRVPLALKQVERWRGGLQKEELWPGVQVIRSLGPGSRGAVSSPMPTPPRLQGPTSCLLWGFGDTEARLLPSQAGGGGGPLTQHCANLTQTHSEAPGTQACSREIPKSGTAGSALPQDEFRTSQEWGIPGPAATVCGEGGGSEPRSEGGWRAHLGVGSGLDLAGCHSGACGLRP